ncbi:unnamed protein product, partial [Ectocarpus fasciculatus]
DIRNKPVHDDPIAGLFSTAARAISPIYYGWLRVEGSSWVYAKYDTSKADRPTNTNIQQSIPTYLPVTDETTLASTNLRAVPSFSVAESTDASAATTTQNTDQYQKSTIPNEFLPTPVLTPSLLPKYETENDHPGLRSPDMNAYSRRGRGTSWTSGVALARPGLLLASSRRRLQLRPDKSAHLGPYR